MNGEQEGEQPQMRIMTVSDSPQKNDVAGAAQEFLDDIILNIEQEGIFKSMGVAPNKTYGLFGKPGTGKTMAISALNNHMNYNLYNKALTGDTDTIGMGDYDLAVFEYSIGRFGTAYINRGSRTVQRFFDQCGVIAQYGKKVLVVLDECDALLQSRTGGVQGHSEDRKVLETIMKNLQILHDTPNMYAVLMSNLPEACDEASLRAGRIDKKYKFGLPDVDERSQAFKLAINQANRRANYKVVRGQQYGPLSLGSEGFSYADIMQTVEEAVRGRAKEVAMDKTKGIMPAAYITQKRLETAVANHTKNFIKVKEKARIGFK